jgi:hypothetical protein
MNDNMYGTKDMEKSTAVVGNSMEGPSQPSHYWVYIQRK